jgi:carbonic anhydrase
MKRFALKVFVAAALAGLVLVPLGAEAPDGWAGFITYAPHPASTAVVLPKSDLVWLDDTALALGKESFTFLGRKDAGHFLSLTLQGKGYLLQIHDEANLFDFRGVVDPKSGKITVERGVDWIGTTRQADADRVSRMAISYLDRARKAEDLFPGPMMVKPAPVTPPGASKAMKEPAPAPMAPATKTSLEDSSGSGDPWQRLVDGNLRFVSGTVTHPNQSMARIAETSKAQHPFAIVVSCSDSRVPPEVLFDQGIGDLFVVRTAGEVVTEVELGSIEYAVEHLGAPYLVVMGHKRCGAVDATLKGGDLPPDIEAIAAQIRPAVEAARFLPGDTLDNAVRENTQLVLRKIKTTPLLATALKEGKLNVKAAYYDIDSGKVAALP